MSWRAEADRRKAGRSAPMPWRPCPPPALGGCGNTWGLRPFFPMDLASPYRWRCTCGHQASTAEADASFLEHAARTYPESRWDVARDKVNR